jgi:CheY-like chemotaxis protein
MTREAMVVMKVLVLVDDLLFASRIEGTLGACGYDVRIAPVMLEVAQVAREWAPDGIVISFGTPFQDWEGAIRAIRSEPSFGDAAPRLRAACGYGGTRGSG